MSALAICILVIFLPLKTKIRNSDYFEISPGYTVPCELLFTRLYHSSVHDPNQYQKLGLPPKKAKSQGQPSPIFFLGAGASVTGDIPLASAIVREVLARFGEDPSIDELDGATATYAEVMACLQPYERKALFAEYIERAKLNVTHIYLANLKRYGYVDYVLTVNFDDLMLRALSLFNDFPPTYDLATLKGLTTSNFPLGSIIYLHGRHNGLWQLNTADKLGIVGEVVPRIFSKISNERPWVFIGYSGDDSVFNHVQDIGRFDHGMYWVGYKENRVSAQVEAFLKKPNTNAKYIKGFDADAFMLKLTNELGVEQPAIYAKPFTVLERTLAGLKDVEDEEHFKGLSARLTQSRKDVRAAIAQFEQGDPSTRSAEEVDAEKLNREMLAMIASEEFDHSRVEELKEIVTQSNDSTLVETLVNLLFNLGFAEGRKADDATSIEQKRSHYHTAGKHLESLLTFKPDKHEALNNWGAALAELAALSESAEGTRDLYRAAIDKYEAAVAVKPDYHEALYNWGVALAILAALSETTEGTRDLYQAAIDKYEAAVAVKPDDHEALYNWGVALANLGGLSETTEGTLALYRAAIEKYEASVVVKPDDREALYNLGGALMKLLLTALEDKGQEQDIARARQVLEQAVALGAPSYNLACWHARFGKPQDALSLLEKALSQTNITASFVRADEGWAAFHGQEAFEALLARFEDA